MTDLQLSLAIVGGVVVAAVFVFNRMQERKLRREAERTFRGEHPDVLLDTPPVRPGAAPEPLREPTFSAAPLLDDEPEPQPEAQVAAEHLIDPVVDYVVAMKAREPVARAAVESTLAGLAGPGKRTYALGRDPGGDAWYELDAGPAHFDALQLAIQLVDRAGPIAEHELADFGVRAEAIAKALDMVAQRGPLDQALDQAARLDAFCARYDVDIGLNVLLPEGARMDGNEVAEFAGEAGLALSRAGTYELRLPGRAAPLFSMTNYEPRPFPMANPESFHTTGVTFLLDVPRCPDGLAAFDRMTALAATMAKRMRASVVDDNRAPLAPPGIAQIRAQIQEMYEDMAAAGIPAGGPLAIRLFEMQGPRG